MADGVMEDTDLLLLLLPRRSFGFLHQVSSDLDFFSLFYKIHSHCQVFCLPSIYFWNDMILRTGSRFPSSSISPEADATKEGFLYWYIFFESLMWRT